MRRRLMPTLLVSITLMLLLGGFQAGATPPTLTCPVSPPTIVGTDAGEDLVGTEGHDIIYAGAGDDVIHGLGGGDILCGDAGNDVIYGDADLDWVVGGIGDATLLAGSDTPTPDQSQRGILDGGPGADILVGSRPVTTSCSASATRRAPRPEPPTATTP
jgi:RTX calcium-binding nonapeptide repeat (4 copies)